MVRADPANGGGWSPEDYLANTSLTYRIGAHETRLGGAVEGTTREVEGLKGRAGIPDCNQFTMTRNIHVLLYSFESFTDDFVLVHH